MKVHLPNSAFLGNIDPFLRSFDTSDPTMLTITTNKKWISIHPVVLAMVAATGLSVPPQQIYCQKLEAASKHYLKRMGLFKMLRIPSDISVTEHEPAGRFIPLTQIKTSEELTRFITDMIPLLHLDKHQADPIKYIISELVRNALEHARSDIGAIVSAQYYKKSNTIRVGIADTGIGVKKTITLAHTAHTHLDALRLALTPGITGMTRREGGTELNAGAGLFFIKSIARVNRDFFMIYSGTAMYKLLKAKPRKNHIRLYADPLKDRHSKGNDFPLWKGTCIGIDMTLDDTEEFTVLLEYIRKTYVQTVKERKKAQYKKPRFE
jgi:anti-sigma regulatory factor (Ser/Thr protein kinase)